MFALSKFENIYLCCQHVDFRKGVGGLSSIIQDQLNLSPFSNYLFLFCNKSRKKVKAIYWDKTGFACWYKTLERDKYHWPFHLESETVIVSPEKLKKMLSGFNPWSIPHKKLDYKIL